MERTKANIWAEFGVSKSNFSSALDQLTENGRAKITALPWRDFKRTPEGVEQFFQWTKKMVSNHEIHIIMES